MTIHRQHRNIVFECDSCGETLDTETADFHEAWAAAKRDDWITRKISNVWFHYCPNCGSNFR